MPQIDDRMVIVRAALVNVKNVKKIHAFSIFDLNQGCIFVWSAAECSRVQQSAAKCSKVQQSAAKCSNVQLINMHNQYFENLRRVPVTDVMLADIGKMEISDTAKLRRIYGTLNSLLKDGYNHKKICEHLYSRGIEIPYPQYRAIMSRLRKENKVNKGKLSQVYSAVVHSENVKNGHVSTDTLVGGNANDGQLFNSESAPNNGLSWDPGSAVKWK